MGRHVPWQWLVLISVFLIAALAEADDVNYSCEAVHKVPEQERCKFVTSECDTGRSVVQQECASEGGTLHEDIAWLPAQQVVASHSCHGITAMSSQQG